jgi:hypothetical protein
MDNPKSFPNDARVAKQLTDFFRVSICCDVKIFWGFAQQQITNTSADEVCLEAMVLQATEYLAGIDTDGTFFNRT